MNWQEKAEALNALSEITLHMRKAGDWYVSQDLEVKEHKGYFLTGKYGNGQTPELAILDHWKVLCDDLSHKEYLVIRSMGERRRAVRWNGYMWADVKEG